MTDSHTRSKLWGDGFSSTVPISCRSNEYLQLKRYYLGSEPNTTHNCSGRHKAKENDDDWLVFMLAFGLGQTMGNPNQITDLKNGNKFLRMVKLESFGDGFSFPKAVCCTKDGIIAIADTGNNRVIACNDGGVQVFVFDAFDYRNKTHRVSSPLSLCPLINGNIAVCNYGDCTINVITHRGTNRLMFKCSTRPIFVASDRAESIFVLKESQEIEEFSKSGKTIKILKINDGTKKMYTMMAVSAHSEDIFLGKYGSSDMLVISKLGETLRRMTLMVPGSGLCVHISNVALTHDGDILVADSLNKSVHIFNSRSAEYKTTLINKKSGLGSVQAVCVTNANSLVTTEYSLTEAHCVKMFSCSNDF